VFLYFLRWHCLDLFDLGLRLKVGHPRLKEFSAFFLAGILAFLHFSGFGLDLALFFIGQPLM
jgi:hypothetical protein